MTETYQRQVKIARALGQWASDSLAFAMAYALTQESQMPRFLVLFGLWSFWAMIKRSYTGRTPFWTQLHSLMKWTIGLTLLALIFPLLTNDSSASVSTLAFGVYLMALIPTGRWVARKLLNKIGLWVVDVVIFGDGVNAEQALLAFRSEPDLGFEVKAFVQLKTDENSLQIKVPRHKWPVNDADFEMFKNYHCVIALEAHQSSLRDQLIRQLSHHEIERVSVIPSMRGVPLFGLETTHFSATKY